MIRGIPVVLYLLLGAVAALGPGCGDGHEHSHKDHHHDHDHSGPNPHIWLDPVLAQQLVEHAGEQLAPMFDGDAPKRNIVVSIHPLKGLIDGVVGERARVDVLLPPGRSPHGFELTPDQMRLLERADALIVVGRKLDDWALKAAKPRGKSIAVVSLADALDHKHGKDEKHDDRDEDAHDDDDHAEHALSAGVEAVVTKLKALDAKHKQQLADVKVKQLVTFHNAFDLLAERYGLEVVEHLTEIELAGGREVTPEQLDEVTHAVEAHGLKVLYAEPQFPDRALHAVRQATGVAILRLDPLGNPNQDGYRDYFEMMESNLKVLAEGQSR